MEHYEDLTLARRIGKYGVIFLVLVIIFLFVSIYLKSTYVDYKNFSKTFCLYDRDKIMHKTEERIEVEETCTKIFKKTKVKLSFILLVVKSRNEKKDIFDRIPPVADNEIRYVYREYVEKIDFEYGKRLQIDPGSHQQAIKNAIMDLKLKSGVTGLDFLFENAQKNIVLK